MPTYDYECEKKHRFEIFGKPTLPIVQVCPKCGKTSKRIISGGAGVHFKGPGFYVTDNPSEGRKLKQYRDDLMNDPERLS